MLMASLQAKEVFLVDTPKCKVLVDDANLSDVVLQGYCDLGKREKRVIDDIKYSIEEPVTIDSYLDGFINSHNPQRKGQFFLYKLNDYEQINRFATVPKYKLFMLHGKKYMFITYRIDGSSSKVVLQKYDENLYKERVAFINTIPRDVTITKLFTEATLRYLVAKLLQAKAHFDKTISQASIEKALYHELTYEQIIQEYKDTRVFDDLFTSHTFLQMISFEEKLKLLRLLKKYKDSSYLFSLYSTLNHGYRFDDKSKEIKLQIQAINYILAHYDELRAYLPLNPKDERVSPLDVECVTLMNLYKDGGV